MKNYTITVNGTPYNVTVEDANGSAAPVAAAPAPAAAPASAPAPAPAAAPVAAGSVSVDAPMPGNILDIKVSNGASVKAGDAVLRLEAMKMELSIKAHGDVTVQKILVAVGQQVSPWQRMIDFASTLYE